MIANRFVHSDGGVLGGSALIVSLVAARSRGLFQANMLDADRIIQLVLGLLIGLFHLALGMAKIFVFRNEEATVSWIYVLSGPLSTLAGAIPAFFSPLIGGIWLLSGAAVSLDCARIVLASITLQPIYELDLTLCWNWSE